MQICKQLLGTDKTFLDFTKSTNILLNVWPVDRGTWPHWGFSSFAQQKAESFDLKFIRRINIKTTNGH